MSLQATVSPARLERRIDDRRFFLFMAALLLATAVAGFAPNSIAILSGATRTPPLVIHVHAALMLAWLVLLLAQTGLNSAGRIRTHRTLGLAAFVLIPAIVLVMVLASYVRLGFEEELTSVRSNIALLQLRSIVLFPLFAGYALSARRSSPGTHKRLMIAATIVVMDAAIARMGWLPGSGPRNAGYELMSFYQLLLFAPVAAYDVLSAGRVHRASIWSISLFAVSSLTVNLLWGSEWWLGAAARLAEAIGAR